MTLHTMTLHTLREYGISFREYTHDPILTYEDAERERQIHHWNGIESKNVFLTDKKGGYYLFVTYQGMKVDFEKMREITGKKLSLASRDEVREHSGCVPGSVSPLLFRDDIMTIVDHSLFQHDLYLFSPGTLTDTIELHSSDLKAILEKQKNTVFI